jgi:hypothetical protein
MKYNRVSVATAAVALTVGALASGASPAGATAGDDVAVMACYDTQTFFSKAPGGYTYPYAPDLRTTSACSDINIKLDIGAEVRVCFDNTGCQDQFTFAGSGKWTTVATGVRDNVAYHFQFATEFAQSGYIAD